MWAQRERRRLDPRPSSNIIYIIRLRGCGIQLPRRSNAPERWLWLAAPLLTAATECCAETRHGGHARPSRDRGRLHRPRSAQPAWWMAEDAGGRGFAAASALAWRTRTLVGVADGEGLCPGGHAREPRRACAARREQAWRAARRSGAPGSGLGGWASRSRSAHRAPGLRLLTGWARAAGPGARGARPRRPPLSRVRRAGGLRARRDRRARPRARRRRGAG